MIKEEKLKEKLRKEKLAQKSLQEQIRNVQRSPLAQKNKHTYKKRQSDITTQLLNNAGYLPDIKIHPSQRDHL